MEFALGELSVSVIPQTGSRLWYTESYASEVSNSQDFARGSKKAATPWSDVYTVAMDVGLRQHVSQAAHRSLYLPLRNTPYVDRGAIASILKEGILRWCRDGKLGVKFPRMSRHHQDGFPVVTNVVIVDPRGEARGYAIVAFENHRQARAVRLGRGLALSPALPHAPPLQLLPSPLHPPTASLLSPNTWGVSRGRRVHFSAYVSFPKKSERGRIISLRIPLFPP